MGNDDFKEGNSSPQDKSSVIDDDEPDEWDARINHTGCSKENMKLTDCYFEKKDWRKCTEELAEFHKCWKENSNDQRTSMKDVESKK